MTDPPSDKMKPGDGTKYFWKIEHTLMWARILFDREFSDSAKTAKQFMIDPGGFEESLADKYRTTIVSINIVVRTYKVT